MAAFHSWTIPSLLAAASVVPSGLNATASTGLRSELIGAPISCWVAAFHSRTFPSLPPVARVVPSGLNAIDPPLVIPASGCVAIVAWSARSQTPTAAGPATSRVLPPPVNASASAAPPHDAVLIRRCEAMSHSRIVPSW